VHWLLRIFPPPFVEVFPPPFASTVRVWGPVGDSALAVVTTTHAAGVGLRAVRRSVIVSPDLVSCVEFPVVSKPRPKTRQNAEPTRADWQIARRLVRKLDQPGRPGMVPLHPSTIVAAAAKAGIAIRDPLLSELLARADPTRDLVVVAGVEHYPVEGDVFSLRTWHISGAFAALERTLDAVASSPAFARWEALPAELSTLAECRRACPGDGPVVDAPALVRNFLAETFDDRA
jgi:hypothetical protein